MPWRNLPYWLKGAVISVVIYVVLFILLFFVAFAALSPSDPGFFAEAIVYITFLPSQILMGDRNPYVSLITYLVIGAIIGLIYGKIKSRKQSQTPPPQS